MHLSLKVAAALAAAGIALPATAQAVGTPVTQSAITTQLPAQMFVDVDDTTVPHVLSVQGTSDGDSSSSLDIVCLDGTSSRPLETVPVGADGTWSAELDAERVSGWFCRLAAIPSGGDARTLDLSRFTGPRTTTTRVQRYFNNGRMDNFYLQAYGTGAYNDLLSLGSCGLCDSRLINGTRSGTGWLWFDNGAAFTSYTWNGETVPYITVDGHPGQVNYMQGFLRDSDTYKPLQLTVTADERSGSTSYVEADSINRCDVLPPRASDCPSFQESGVAVERTATVSPDGRRTDFVDAYRSTDGQAHTADVTMEEWTQNSQNGIRFPGDADFRTTALDAGETIGDLPEDSVIAFRRSMSEPTSLDNPEGALIVTSPEEIRSGESVNGFYLRHVLDVPATGTVTVTRSYVMGESHDEVVARTNDVIDGRHAPAVTVDGLPASVDASELTLKGDVTDNVGVTKLTVDGAEAAIDGKRWSKGVTLVEGENAFEVVATDAAGTTTKKTVKVTYVKPVAAETPALAAAPKPAAIAPVLIGKGSLRVKRGRLFVGRVLGCKISGPACKAYVLVSAKIGGKTVTLGKATLTAQPGRYRALRVPLSKAARKALARSKATKVSVAIDATAIGAGRTTKVAAGTYRRR